MSDKQSFEPFCIGDCTSDGIDVAAFLCGVPSMPLSEGEFKNRLLKTIGIYLHL